MVSNNGSSLDRGHVHVNNVQRDPEKMLSLHFSLFEGEGGGLFFKKKNLKIKKWGILTFLVQ